MDQINVPRMNWALPVTLLVRECIGEFQLRRLGHQGFSHLPWVTYICSRRPELSLIAHTASSVRKTSHVEDMQAVLTQLASDRSAREAAACFFLGKLALEELSCAMHGAGAGACDKRSAYTELVELCRHNLAN